MERSLTHPITDDEEEPFDIEYDCPKCGINRGKHDVSKRNRLIPCESDGEDDEEEDEEQEVKCVCEFCFGEGVCYVSKQRATELKEKGLMEQSCPFGDKCAYEEEDEICGQDGCDCVLCEDTPIMCYSNEEGDLTLCNNCYWDNEYWRDDQNEDNEDEIKDHICVSLRRDPNFVS